MRPILSVSYLLLYTCLCLVVLCNNFNAYGFSSNIYNPDGSVNTYKLGNTLAEFSISIKSVFAKIDRLRIEERLDSGDYADIYSHFNQYNTHYQKRLNIIIQKYDSLKRLHNYLLLAKDTSEVKRTIVTIRKYNDYITSYRKKIIQVKKHRYNQMIRLLQGQHNAIKQQGQLIKEVLQAAKDYQEEFKVVQYLSEEYKNTSIFLVNDLNNKVKRRDKLVQEHRNSPENTYKRLVIPAIKEADEAKRSYLRFQYKNQDFNFLYQSFKELSTQLSGYQKLSRTFLPKYKILTSLIRKYQTGLKELAIAN